MSLLSLSSLFAGYRNPFELLAPISRRDQFDVVLFSPNKLLKDKRVGSDQSNFTVDPQSEERKSAELKNVWIDMKTKMQEHVRDIHDQDHCPPKRLTMSGDKQVVQCFTCLTEAMDWIHVYTGRDGQSDGKETHVLVTGSLHLVGGVLSFIDTKAESLN